VEKAFSNAAPVTIAKVTAVCHFLYSS